MNPVELCPVRKAAQTFPANVALMAGTRTLSYKDLDPMVERMAVRLRHLSVGPDSRIAVIHPNSLETVLVFLALWRIGAIACFINPKEPLDAINAKAAQTGCSLLLAANSLMLGLKVPGAKGVVITNLVSHNPIQPHENFPAETPTDFTRPATIVFTSGSSGTPKAVVHSLDNHYFNAKGSNEHIPVSSGDRWLLSLPLFHVSGLGILFRCLLGGGTVVIPSPADDLAASIEKFGITHVSMVPTQLARLLKEEKGKALQKLKAILLGGAPIPPQLLVRAKELDLPVYITYGLSEMASQVATSPCLKTAQWPLAAKVLPHRQIKIANGEIFVKGEPLFLGYWQEGKIHRPLTSDGWFATGDCGRLDEHGLTVTGRKDNLFISGGENIYPEEIEKELLGIPGVEEAVVFPEDDDEFGQRPIAVIRTEEGKLTRAILTAALEKKLPRFKVPMNFYLFPENPDVFGVKTSRAHLQSRFIAQPETFPPLK